MKQNVRSLLLVVVISTAFTGCTVTRPSTAAASNSATFQMRLVLDAPSNDATEMSILQKADSPTPREVVYVQNAVLLDQTALKSAKIARDNFGHAEIAITFTDAGRERFAEVTRQSIGKRLAIVIDGQLYSAPSIVTEIPGGKANISGSFSDREAEELVARLNSSLKR
jgi:preprotein translocase subunit SecD